MVLTKSNSNAALTHVVENVINANSRANGQILTVLNENGINGILDLVTIKSEDIEDLTHTMPDGTILNINKGESGLIKSFISFVRFRMSTGKPFTDDQWITITYDEFQEYRGSMDYYDIDTGVVGIPPAPGTKSTSTTTASRDTRNPVDEFKKGMRRDPSAFSRISDDKQFDNWRRTTVAQARAQGVDDVLNPSFKPGNEPDKIALFQEKQKYMYAVFDKIMGTDEGRKCVRSYIETFDAQKVYSDFIDATLKSTKTSLDSARILSYITSEKFGEGAWKGTAHSFIRHWQEQVRLYDDQCAKESDKFSSAQRMAMLQNAVNGIEELRAVKVQADQFHASSGDSVTYEQYVSLLISAAANYDIQFTVGNKGRGTQRSDKRAVYNHDIEDNGVVYGIDSSISEIQAYAHSSTTNSDRFDEYLAFMTARANGSTMAREQWIRLDPATQKVWDTIVPEMKAIILERATATTVRPAFRPTRPGGKHSSGRPPSRPMPILDVNMHEITAYEYMQAQMHQMELQTDQHVEETTDDTTALLAHVTNRTTLPPSDIRTIMSSNITRPPDRNDSARDNKYRQCNMMEYTVSNHLRSGDGSLVDRGANGGIAGGDVRIINKTTKSVNIRGIDNHQLTNIPIVTAGGVTMTQHGEVIIILHQYAYTGKGKSIHSAAQLEWFKNDVNDKSIKVAGGLQRIATNDGYVHPIKIQDGLAYVSLRPYTDKEWGELPHVLWTGDTDWDPCVLDHDPDDDEEWYDAVTRLEADPHMNLFDEFGNYRKRVIIQEAEIFFDTQETSATYDDTTLEEVIQDCIGHAYTVKNHQINRQTPDYEALRPLFGWLPTDVIKRTFAATTQFARMPMSAVLQKHYKSPFPACNIHRRNESVATDTVYSDTPAVDSGFTSAQIFVGTTSLLTDVYGMRTDKQFVNTLEDNIRTRGAPNKLISDRAQVEISKKIHDILRAYSIGNWQSEPHQQQQNPAERRYQTVKRMTNTILDRVGAPAYTWLLCLMYVCFILNVTVSSGGDYVPLQVATGSMADISPLLRFRFMEPVYYKLDDSDFPSESREKRGYFVGFAEHVGHYMTVKVLTDDTKKVLYRSNVRSALNSKERNLRMDPLGGETKFIVKSRQDQFEDDGTKTNPQGSKNGETNEEEETNVPKMPVFSPDDIVGRTFLLEPQEDGQRFRARIVRAIKDQDDELARHPDKIKFLCSINDDQYEEILSYNEVLDHIENVTDDDEPAVWKFRRISAHQGPLRPNHNDWKGSEYNVTVEWENGEITDEPLCTIAADDPVTCALYAKDNDLLELKGWKRFKSIAKRQKKLLRMVNQAKLRSYRTAPKYQYGYQVPHDYAQAVKLDEKAGNTKWQDATKLEMGQLDEYDTFKNHGLNGKPPDNYKKIRVHLIFAVKHDGRQKARCVTDGHLTEIPIESVYSGVVSLRGLRLLVFLGELNGLETWATDIGNAYLEAVTQEKVYIIAGPEFGERQGHTLVIFKALYGLRTSGQRWHERFAECLDEMGFVPCKAEPDIWMRKNGAIYEYIAVYVDDLAIAAKDPKSITDTLMEKYEFKLKGTGPITFHLGCDFFRDKDGVLCMAPKRYIEKMIDTYESMFGTKPKMNVSSPLEKGDHPETDTTELLDQEGIQKYQSLIGAMQWAVSIGRIDITTAVMTLSGYRTAPRLGHLERAKRVYGYLAKMKHAVIRVRTEEPDFSGLPDQDFDWATSVYGNITELLPQNAPEPLGKYVTLSHYVDANLFHDLLTGRSVTGILHFANKTPIDWYSKKQATVETATYGSEFVAARTCTEQIIDLRTTLRYLGVPIRDKSFMFGDNKSVVDSSMTPHAKLHKRHMALSFHRVREAIASKIIGFYHIAGEQNPADILSKHWGYQQVWKLLKPLLFWQGDTLDVLDVNSKNTENEKWQG